MGSGQSVEKKSPTKETDESPVKDSRGLLGILSGGLVDFYSPQLRKLKSPLSRMLPLTSLQLLPPLLT